MREFLEHIQGIINNNEDLPNVRIGQLEPDINDVSIQLMPSPTLHEYMDRGKTVPLSILILAKDRDQTQAIQNVQDILNYFSTLTNFTQPTQGGIQWLTAYVSTYQNFVTKTENKFYIYSGSLVCKINI